MIKLKTILKIKLFHLDTQKKSNVKKKTQSKRRGKFRKMIDNNYRIKNNRLQYKYVYKKESKWLNIPYENEVVPILNYIHYNNKHIKKDKMAVKIIDLGLLLILINV